MSGGKNAKFMENPVAFMERYAVLPADDVAGYIGDKAVSMDTEAEVGNAYIFSAIEPDKKVAWLNFAKKPKKGALSFFVHSSEGTICVDGTFTARPHTVKSYFLPWTAGGGIIHLTIPDKNNVPHGQEDADYFFTATITGCSVFIKGTARNPTIYHGGGDTKQSDPDDAATFWSDLMTAYSGAGAVIGEVDKRDYVSDPQATLAGRTTRNAEIFETWLKNNSPRDLQIEYTAPWGCVMGIRDAGGSWTFYLQENATIMFYQLKKQSLLSKTMVKAGTMRAAGRPMIFREIFPNGAGHQVLAPQLPRKI